MNNPAGVVATSVLGILLCIGNPTNARTQESKSVVHPAPASQVITVTVTDVRHSKHGPDTDVLIAQAVGFPNDTCDVITTFDVVKAYEERQTWRNVRQRVDIVINGTPYPAKFRDIGFYPLGLNLACIDFDSPYVHSQLKIPVLQLDRDSAGLAALSYEDKEIANSDPGTPFLNPQGQVSSVLLTTENGQLEFATAEQIRSFLKVAADVAPWPTLSRRPLSAT
jgi:hypothetical protein